MNAHDAARKRTNACLDLMRNALIDLAESGARTARAMYAWNLIADEMTRLLPPKPKPRVRPVKGKRTRSNAPAHFHEHPEGM